jgi:hypothetical protein
MCDASGQGAYRCSYIALVYPLLSVVESDNFVFRSWSYDFYITNTSAQHR